MEVVKKKLNNHTGNLERHLKRFHPTLYSDYVAIKCANKNKVNDLKTKTVPTHFNQTNIELAIVELFTRNGRPLRMAEDRAFKTLVQPAFDALGINVNEHNVAERIIAFSKKVKLDIMDDLKDKMISLKIDAATRQDLSVLGINVQYIKNASIQIKTLAIKELKLSHTSEYLKTIILEVLKEYEINIHQILTITTDNGANMVKAVKDMNTNLQDSLQRERFSTEEYIDINSIENKMDVIVSNFSVYNITGVRCGAHTLQLCVLDVIKVLEIKNKLDTIRSIVKKLRTQSYLNILKTSNYKKPIIDCATRWNSTFDMLRRLLDIKDIIEPLSNENQSLYLSANDWIFVKEFIDIFEPVYNATIKLQSEQLCYSELYIIIMDLLFQVDNLAPSDMSKLLKTSLNHRKSKLFDKELFNAAVLLDPRIKICLDSQQKERAKKYIIGLYKRINSITGKYPTDIFTNLK